jgi:hypothetical protein
VTEQNPATELRRIDRFAALSDADVALLVQHGTRVHIPAHFTSGAVQELIDNVPAFRTALEQTTADRLGSQA